MPTFRVTEKDIENLSDFEFADVMNQLLRAEAAKCRLPERCIQTSLNIKANDVGVDCRVVAPGIQGSQYCPDGPGVWQYKAEDATPKKLEKEVRKGGVVAELQQGGYYRAAIARAYSDSSRRSRDNTLRDAAKKVANNLRDDATGILTAADIAAWASQYAAVVQLPYFSHPVGNLLTFTDWARSPRHRRSYIALDAATRRIDEIRAGLGDAQNGGHVAVVGRAGTGKTRLALEALKGTGWEHLCLYAPSPDAIPNGFFNWVQTHPNDYVVLVVDQCTPQEIETLHEYAAPSSERVRIITIGADRAFAAITHASMVEAPAITEEDMRRYVEQIAPSLPISHRRFVAEISGGYIELAGDLCDVGAANPSVISNLSSLHGNERIKVLVNALLPNDSRRRAMGILALLKRVGLWDEVEDQGQALAAFSGATIGDLRAAAREMEYLGRVAIRGRYCMVTPPLLAVWLAWEMWRDRVADIETTLLPSLSGEGQAALFERLRDLGEHPTAAQFVRDRLGALLSGACVAAVPDSPPSTTLAMAATALPPRETARNLEQRLGQLPDGAWQGDTIGSLSRRDLVPLLARLAWHEESFVIAARLLRRLSDHETEPWANNATGIWEGLFRVQLGGTSVPFERRLPLLDEVVGRPTAALRRPALGALREALGIMEVRDADAEDQGGRLIAEEWHPTSREENQSARQAALARLDKLCSDDDTDLAHDAWALLLDMARSLIKLGLSDDVILRLEMAPRQADEDVYRLRQCLQEIMAWERGRLTDHQHGQIRALLVSLTGPTWFDRLRRWAGPRAFAEYEQDGDDVTASSPVPDATDQLVNEVIADPALLNEDVWRWLKSAAAANAWPFAERLGRNDGDGLWLSMVYNPDTLRHNAPLLAGYLYGHAAVRSVEWYHNTLEHLSNDFPECADVMAGMTIRGHASERGARDVIELVRRGAIDKRRLSEFAWGTWPDVLPRDTYHDLVVLASDTVSVDTIEGVLMLVANRLCKHLEDRVLLAPVAWSLLEHVDLIKDLAGDLFAWTTVAEMFLPDDPARLAGILLGWAGWASIAVFTSTRAASVLASATKAAPREVWVRVRPVLYPDGGVAGRAHYALRGWYITLFDVNDVLTAARAYGESGAALTAWLCPMAGTVLPPLARALLEQLNTGDQRVGAMLQSAFLTDEEPYNMGWYESKLSIVEQWINDVSLSVSEWARDVKQYLTHRMELARQREVEWRM